MKYQDYLKQAGLKPVKKVKGWHQAYINIRKKVPAEVSFRDFQFSGKKRGF